MPHAIVFVRICGGWYGWYGWRSGIMDLGERGALSLAQPT